MVFVGKSNDKPTEGELQTRIGYWFRNPLMLKVALTHPSASMENSPIARNNQRLEFLGDAVLELVLTHELHDRFPEVGEGPLTKGRAELVNRNALADKAAELELGIHLVISKGEELHGGRGRPSILADAFEALVGAIFLDGGYESARGFVLRQFQSHIEEVAGVPRIENPKGELQEFLQARSCISPLYRLETASGPDHDRDFECSVWHENEELGRGTGKSKKLAEIKAAEMALRRLGVLGAEPSESSEIGASS